MNISRDQNTADAAQHFSSSAAMTLSFGAVNGGS
jgi:hypothetical protein